MNSYSSWEGKGGPCRGPWLPSPLEGPGGIGPGFVHLYLRLIAEATLAKHCPCLAVIIQYGPL